MQHYTVHISNQVNLHQVKTQKAVDYRKDFTLQVMAETPELALMRFVRYLDNGDYVQVTTSEDSGRFDRDAYPISRERVHLGGLITPVRYNPNRLHVDLQICDDQKVINQHIEIA